MPIRLIGNRKFSSGPAQPVLCAGGTMPGGSEMVHWYNHIPFPDPLVLEAKREKLLVEIDRRNAQKVTSIHRVVDDSATEQRRAA